MFWRGLRYLLYDYYAEKYRDSVAYYDLVDLQFDNNRLFNAIIDEQMAHEQYMADENRRTERERILKLVNRIIIESSNEILGLSKSKVIDNVINTLKTEFAWRGIRTDEKIETIFWRDCYDGFVSFMRQSGKPKMTDIFDLDIDDIKEAGFSTRYISEIVGIVSNWAEHVLSTEVDVGEKLEESDDEIEETIEIDGSDEVNTDADIVKGESSTDIVDDLLSMFFRFGENAE
jgi:hypothetical protein